jgi:UDP-N-acetylglucosamine 4-epimerase
MTTLNDLWKMISQNLGVNIDAVHAPQRVGDIKHSLASIKKASRLFGYEPSVPMKEGLKETIEWSKKGQTVQER